MSSRPFLSRVRRALPDLHPAERKLGELVCDFPGELASYSASELAALAGVSNATVTRFVRRLGYPNYEEARRHARSEQQTGSRLFTARATETEISDANAFARIDMDNLAATFAGIELTEIDALARALLSARKVWVVGYRAGAALAVYIYWQLTQVIEDIVAIPGQGHTMGEHIASVAEGDVVIVFGLRRRVSQIDRVLDALDRTGARIAYVTDEGASPRTDAAWHFRCETASAGPLFSHVAVMALLNVLANRTIVFAAEAGRRRLAEIESVNEALDELQ